MANPTLLEMPIARDGAKNSIPSTTSPTTGLLSQQYGWQDINSMPVQQGGKAPSRLDFNGVLNLLSNILFYAQKGWQFEWDSSQAYYAGCVVKDTSDGKMYQCLNDVTSTTAPHSDTTNWKIWDLSNYINNEDGIWQTWENVLFRNNNLYSMILQCGNANDAGGQLLLGGKNNGTYKGGFYLTAQNDNDGDKTLEGHANGTLTWGGNDLAGNAIKSKSIGAALGYKITADGFHIEYGRQVISASTPTDITFGVSYNGGYVASVTPSSGTVSVGHTDLTKMTITTSNTVYVDWITVGQ